MAFGPKSTCAPSKLKLSTSSQRFSYCPPVICVELHNHYTSWELPQLLNDIYRRARMYVFWSVEEGGDTARCFPTDVRPDAPYWTLLDFGYSKACLAQVVSVFLLLPCVHLHVVAAGMLVTWPTIAAIRLDLFGIISLLFSPRCP
jgi:hypothetical protein